MQPSGAWQHARSVLACRYLCHMSQGVDCVAEKRDVAQDLAGELRRLDGVEAVILFGSTARGDAYEESDVDLLVLTCLGSDPGRVRRICSEMRAQKVSLVLHTSSSFERLKGQDWLFVRHLRDEGVTLWETGTEFGDRSCVSFPGQSAVIREIQHGRRDVERLSDIERYGDDFLFPLANVYGLTKRIAMLANARAGISVFNRERAICACAQLYPDVAAELGQLRLLAPFYAQTRGVRGANGPFSSDGAGRQLLASTEALERVIDAVSVA
jgi:predicted nucleotidyltransferase